MSEKANLIYIKKVKVSFFTSPTGLLDRVTGNPNLRM